MNDPNNPDQAGDWYANQPPEDERRHSSACVDATEVDGIENCICQPDEQAPAPATYELWWCSYCGEPSCEDSDPCQRCGEAIERIPLVRVSEVAEWLRYESAPVCCVADEFLARFGGGDER